MATPLPVDQAMYDRISYLLGADDEGKPVCPNISKLARTTLFPNLDPFCLVGNISMIEDPIGKGATCKAIHLLFAENPNYNSTKERSFYKNMAGLEELFAATCKEELVYNMFIKGEKLEIKAKFDPDSFCKRFLAVVGATSEGKPITIETRLYSIVMPLDADKYTEIRKFMPLMAEKKVLLPTEIEQFNDLVRPEYITIPTKEISPKKETVSREETAYKGPSSSGASPSAATPQ